ncbi:MAG: protein TolR, partial [Candidatus Aenigmatarchaeota archaeon]
VIPLVDIVLVLLIIFMITAPMLQHGMDVDLPKVTASPLQPNEEPIVITIRKDGSTYINENPVDPKSLQEKLKAIVRKLPEKEVFLRADRAVPYGIVMEIMAEIRKAGIEKIGMVTQPLEEKE